MKLRPLTSAKHAPLTPFFIITTKGREIAISRETARSWWHAVPESHGKILIEDDSGRRPWNGEEIQ